MEAFPMKKCVERGCKFETKYPFSMLCHENIHAALKVMDPEIVSAITAFDFGLLSKDPVEFTILEGNESRSSAVVEDNQHDLNEMESSSTLAFKNGEHESSSENFNGVPSPGDKRDVAHGMPTNGEFRDGMRSSNGSDKIAASNKISDVATSHFSSDMKKKRRGTCNKDQFNSNLGVPGLRPAKFETTKSSPYLRKRYTNPDSKEQPNINNYQTNVSEDKIVEPQPSSHSVGKITDPCNNSCNKIAGGESEAAQDSAVASTNCDQLSFNKKQEVFTARTITSTGIKWESYSEIQKYVIDSKLLLPPRINKVRKSNTAKRKKPRK